MVTSFVLGPEVPIGSVAQSAARSSRAANGAGEEQLVAVLATVVRAKDVVGIGEELVVLARVVGALEQVDGVLVRFSLSSVPSALEMPGVMASNILPLVHGNGRHGGFGGRFHRDLGPNRCCEGDGRGQERPADCLKRKVRFHGNAVSEKRGEICRHADDSRWAGRRIGHRITAQGLLRGRPGCTSPGDPRSGHANDNSLRGPVQGSIQTLSWIRQRIRNSGTRPRPLLQEAERDTGLRRVVVREVNTFRRLGQYHRVVTGRLGGERLPRVRVEGSGPAAQLEPRGSRPIRSARS